MSVKFHEAYALDSQQDQLLWWDDFLGDQIQDEWQTTGTGVWAVIDQQTGGIARISLDTGENGEIDWNNIRSLLVTKRVSAEFRVKWGTIANVLGNFGLMFDANNRIRFIESGTRWDIECRDGGVATTLDSGVVPDTSYHIFRIECHTHGANHVHFYIDGTETGNSPITTNIPDDATDYFQPHLYVTSGADGQAVDIDYIVVRQEI